MFGDPPEASLPELANYPLEASRTRIPRLLAATNTQGSPRIIATDPHMPLGRRYRAPLRKLPLTWGIFLLDTSS
jgi:hypothetical protein